MRNRSVFRPAFVACYLFLTIFAHGTLATQTPVSPFINESEVSKHPEAARAVSQMKTFLDYLQTLAPAKPKAGGGKFDALSGKRIDPQVFLGYVASTGVNFTSVTATTVGQVARSDLRTLLKSQRGPVVSAIREVAYNLKWSIGENRHYERIDADTFSVSLSEYYILRFVNEADSYRLSEWRDIAPEMGD